MNHIEWKETSDGTHYGYWEGAKCFSVYRPITGTPMNAPRNVVTISKTQWRIKSSLPGFRDDLPLQTTVDAAKLFAERMLQRWAAKRGLLFKAHIVVTDAMCVAAARVVAAEAGEHYDALNSFAQTALCDTQRKAITEALQAREPHAASASNQNNSVRRAGN